MPNPLIYLASASPRRSALLTQIGVTHEVRPVDIDESPRPGEAPANYVTRLASAKAHTLWSKLDESTACVVIGSDTSVVIDNEILGKPTDRDEGIGMLNRLSGRRHEVFTAVAVQSAAGLAQRLSVSQVTFRSLDRHECESYWNSGEPHDKAGGYAVQGLAAAFIERIEGSYSGIMGLPLFETAQLLSVVGVAPLAGAGR
jgi:septum formation protein